jgi:hypothetical protein
MRGEIINEYRKLNSEDQKAFRRFLWTNAVVGAILLAGLIVLAVNVPGDKSEATAQNPAMRTHAKLPWAIMTWSQGHLAEATPPEAIYQPQHLNLH